MPHQSPMSCSVCSGIILKNGEDKRIFPGQGNRNAKGGLLGKGGSTQDRRAVVWSLQSTMRNSKLTRVSVCVGWVCIAEPWPVEQGACCIGLYRGLPRTWPCDSGTLRPLQSQAPGPWGGCAEAWCFFLKKSLLGSLHRQANRN